jgi:hypothetical protein
VKKRNSKKRYENREHLESVARMQCCLKTFRLATNCSGPTQAHHLLKPYDGVRGMGMRSNDKNVIPLCMKHHQELHTKYGSEKSFFEAYGQEESFGKTVAEALFTNLSVYY